MFENVGVVQFGSGWLELGFYEPQRFFRHIGVFVQDSDHIFILDDLDFRYFFSSGYIDSFWRCSMGRRPQYFGMKQTREKDITGEVGLSSDFLHAVHSICRFS